MAHVRTSYPLSLYTGKNVTEQPGDRLVLLSWKSNEKTGRIAHKSVCFSIPSFSPDLTGKDDGYLGMLIEAFEMRQQKIAHTYVTEMYALDGRCMEIPAEVLGNDAVLMNFLEESESDGSRGKLSEEAIKGWFEENLKEILMERLGVAKNWLGAGIDEGSQLTEDQLKVLQQEANVYRAMLQKLAAPTPTIEVNTARKLLKVVELAGNNGTKLKLAKKLDKIINPVVAMIEDALADF